MVFSTSGDGRTGRSDVNVEVGACLMPWPSADKAKDLRVKLIEENTMKALDIGFGNNFLAMMLVK